MSHKFTFIGLVLLLAFSFKLAGSASAASLVQQQPETYSLSVAGAAAAARFRSEPKSKLYADLEVVLKELPQPAAPASPDGRVQYQVISNQQLLDLLGPATIESGEDHLSYSHSYGMTSFYFAGGRLMNVVTLGEPNCTFYTLSYPPQGAAKRLWYKTMKLSHKLTKMLS